MRGRTFKDSFVILDEAQNTTPAQMKMVLTRLGSNTRMAINGDVTQMDIQGESGLTDALHRLSSLPSVRQVRFTLEDCVRDPVIQQVLSRYE